MQLLEHFKELTLHPKNAEELKGLILQLAVQGKLTQQWRVENPDVEPASVLLKKIESEKEKLVKRKKIKKEKSLSNIEEAEIPYSLPNSWEWCKLGHSGYTQTGSTPPKNDSTNYGDYIPFIGPGDISNQWMKYPIEGLSEKGIAVGRLIPKGSLMMVCIGGSIGKCNINEIDVSCNQQINTITPLLIPSDFIKTVCQAPFFQNEVWEKSSGSATPIINKGKWENIIIPLPPLEEQKTIVEVVNQLFAEVEQLEALTKERIQLKSDFVTSALNQLTQAAEQDTASQWVFLQQQFGTFFTEKENVKKLREGILQLAVQGKLTRDWRALQQAKGLPIEHASTLLEKIKTEKEQLIKAKKIKKEKVLLEISEEEIPYVLPEGWVWCRLQDLEYILGDGIHGTPEYSLNGDYFFINGNNLNDGTIEIKPHTKKVSEKEYLKHKRALGNRTILVSINGTIGNTAFYNGEKVMLGKSACYFNLFEGIDKEYIRQLIKSEYFRDYAFLSATGTTIKNVSLQTMRSFVVPFPSLEEQKVIVERVSSLMALCDKLEHEIETHQTTQEQWMQSCLRELVEW